MSTILSFGEILWDIFPDYKKPGGSPANLAYHLHALGNRSNLVSRVGDDQNGEELLSFITDKGLNTAYVQKDPNHPTGTVGVEFDDGEPSYTIHHPASWDFIEMTDQLVEELQHADAICFASLSQREEDSKKSLGKILNGVRDNCLKVFDLNLRPPFIDRDNILECIERADVIKFNEDELAQVSSWVKTENLPKHILSRHPEKIILVTLGAKGSAMHSADGFFEQKAYPVSTGGDFVGVGDAFLACVTHLLLKQISPKDILSGANKYAAFVASQQGGMPEIPGDIIRIVNNP